MKRAILRNAQLSILYIPKGGLATQYLLEWCVQNRAGYYSIIPISTTNADYFAVILRYLVEETTSFSETDHSELLKTCVSYVNNRIEIEEKESVSIIEKSSETLNPAKTMDHLKGTFYPQIADEINRRYD